MRLGQILEWMQESFLGCVTKRPFLAECRMCAFSFGLVYLKSEMPQKLWAETE